MIGWIVAPCTRHRESELADQSNWDAHLEALSAADPSGEGFEVVRVGNPFTGWGEHVMVSPDLAHVVEALRERLENYPLLNEDDYSARQWELACESWDVSRSERVRMCEYVGVSPINALLSIGRLPDRLRSYLESEH